MHPQFIAAFNLPTRLARCKHLSRELSCWKLDSATPPSPENTPIREKEKEEVLHRLGLLQPERGRAEVLYPAVAPLANVIKHHFLSRHDSLACSWPPLA